MAGLIGSHATVVSSGAERKKHYNITTTTTSLTGLQYTPTKVHVYHNGVRLVDGTDYTATNGTSITLTNAAENGDDVVVISYATFQTSDTVSAANGGTFAGDVTFSGAFTSQGIDDNATSTAMTLKSSGNIGIGTSVTSLFNGVGGQARLAVCGSDTSTNVANNSSANIAIINTDTTANNTAALHFARADTDDDPNYAGASIVAQFLDAQVTGEYPKGELAFLTSTSANTAPSEKMRIDNSGNVGIGTSSPLTKAHIQKSDVSFTPDANADMLIVENNGTSAIQIVASTTDKSELFFSDTTRNRGGLSYNHSSDYLAVSSNGSEAMRIDSNRDIQIGKTDGSQNTQGIILNKYGTIRANAQTVEALHLIRSTAGNIARFYHNNTTLVGNINVTSSSTAYNTSSDYRLKENVVDLTGATARLKQLEPKRFNFIVDPDDTTVDGFLAHEVQSVVPEAITGTHNEVDDDGNPVYQGIDQSKLVPLLTAALQEAIAKIETLETEMASVKARLDALEAN